MTPVDQTLFGTRDGDCWTACIASLMECSLESLYCVQHAYREMALAHERSQYKRRNRWWTAVTEMLLRRGVIAARMPVEHMSGYVPRGYSIAAGQSPRGILHCVVVLDGELVHDPHPSRSGLSGPVEDYEVLLPVGRQPC